MFHGNSINENGDSYIDRVSYLVSKQTGRPMYRAHPKNILPLLEEPDEENIPKVYLRIKPSGTFSGAAKFNVTDEVTLTAEVSSESVVNCSLRSVGNSVKHQYKFSKIFCPTSTQKQLFRDTCLQPLQSFLRGENCLLFAYGATNSGKTYTIQGTNENPGIIPQSISMIFSTLKGRVCNNSCYKPHRLANVILLDELKQQEELFVKQHLLGSGVPLSSVYTLEPHTVSNLKMNADFTSPSFQVMKSHLDEVILNLEDEKSTIFSLWVSFYEIHNEVIYDLLDVTNSSDLKRRPLSLGYVNGLAYIKDVRQIHVYSPDEAYQIYLNGKSNLQKASTTLNSDSSRSHCVFSIKMIRILNSETPQPVNVSVFCCVDLAGTERVKKTLNVGDRLRESQNINTSLYVLGRCLSIIRDNQKVQRKVRVPFRDSKLTQVFQYALTGNQGIGMVVNITLDPVMYLETVNVLKFSALARQILVEQNNSHCLSSKSMLSNNASLLKSRETITASSALQPNDCNHLPLINKLQQQLENEQEEKRELAKQLEIEKQRTRATHVPLINKLQQQLENEQEERRELAKQLEIEKQRTRATDACVREELTGEFTSLLKKTEDFWKRQVKLAAEDQEDTGNFQIAQLKEFYEKRLKEMLAQEKELRKQLAFTLEELHSKNMENTELTDKIEDAKDDFIMLEQSRKSLLEELVERRDSHISVHNSSDIDCGDVKVEVSEDESDSMEGRSTEASNVLSLNSSEIIVIDD